MAEALRIISFTFCFLYLLIGISTGIFSFRILSTVGKVKLEFGLDCCLGQCEGSSHGRLNYERTCVRNTAPHAHASRQASERVVFKHSFSRSKKELSRIEESCMPEVHESEKTFESQNKIHLLGTSYLPDPILRAYMN